MSNEKQDMHASGAVRSKYSELTQDKIGKLMAGSFMVYVIIIWILWNNGPSFAPWFIGGCVFWFMLAVASLAFAMWSEHDHNNQIQADIDSHAPKTQEVRRVCEMSLDDIIAAHERREAERAARADEEGESEGDKSSDESTTKDPISESP